MKLSVFVVTYNQEKYIRQCLDSILMQEVDFDYEVVIGEDHGCDGTRAICEEYAEKYPQVRLLPLTENLGIAGNWKRVLSECRGVYIAMCEGDDYWIDDLKLQKQVDFLENNEDVGYLFTRHLRMRKDGTIYDFFESKNISIPQITDLDYLLKNGIMPTTQTVCFRSSLLPKTMPDFMNGHLYADLILLVVIADNCKIGYINDATAMYRENIGMMSKSNTINARGTSKTLFTIYDNLNQYTNGRYKYIFASKSYRYCILYKIYRPYRKYYPIAYFYYIAWQLFEKGFNLKNINTLIKNTLIKFITFFNVSFFCKK